MPDARTDDDRDEAVSTRATVSEEASAQASYLRDSIRDLGALNKKLRRLAEMVVFSSLFHIIWSLMTIPIVLNHQNFGGLPLISGTFYLGMPSTILIVIFVFIVIFDYTRKEGDVLFQEVTDELQTLYGYTSGNKNGANGLFDELRYDARLAVRAFSKFSDLPIVPGRSGPIVYLVLNVCLAAFSIFMLLYRPVV